MQCTQNSGCFPRGSKTVIVRRKRAFLLFPFLTVCRSVSCFHTDRLWGLLPSGLAGWFRVRSRSLCMRSRCYVDWQRRHRPWRVCTDKCWFGGTEKTVHNPGDWITGGSATRVAIRPRTAPVTRETTPLLPMLWFSRVIPLRQCSQRRKKMLLIDLLRSFRQTRSQWRRLDWVLGQTQKKQQVGQAVSMFSKVKVTWNRM